MKKFTLITIAAIFTIFASRAQEVNILLKAHMEGQTTLYDGTVIPIWGFIDWDSTNVDILPSPTLYLTEDDSVYLLVDNVSEMAHTIHLHGLDVNQANDGVPSTSFEIPAYRAGEYHFKAYEPGTYLYHCHVETVIHLQMGMFGAVVIRPKDYPKSIYGANSTFDKEYLWLGSEIDESWHQTIPDNGSVPAYDPDYFLVNGKSKSQIDQDNNIYISAYVNETIALRIANMGYGIHEYYFPENLDVSIIGSDGREFDEVEKSNRLIVYPGERYAVLFNCDTEVEDYVSVQYFSHYNHQLQGENTIPVSITEKQNVSTAKLTQEVPYSLIKNNKNYTLVFDDKQTQKQVRVCDLSGKVLNSYSNVSADLTLQLSQSGVFIVNIWDNGKMYSQKILVD